MSTFIVNNGWSLLPLTQPLIHYVCRSFHFHCGVIIFSFKLSCLLAQMSGEPGNKAKYIIVFETEHLVGILNLKDVNAMP